MWPPAKLVADVRIAERDDQLLLLLLLLPLPLLLLPVVLLLPILLMRAAHDAAQHNLPAPLRVLVPLEAQPQQAVWAAGKGARGVHVRVQGAHVLQEALQGGGFGAADRERSAQA